MIDTTGLLNAVELQLELQELKKLGLSDEEIEGFVEIFVDSWVQADLQDNTN
jgi:hypothetical protein